VSYDELRAVLEELVEWVNEEPELVWVGESVGGGDVGVDFEGMDVDVV